MPTLFDWPAGMWTLTGPSFAAKADPVNAASASRIARHVVLGWHYG